VDISNPSALSSSLNISQTGVIPVGYLQTWALTLHCGPYDAEVDLSIRINVSVRTNITSLEFKRKKICLKDKSYMEPEEVLVAAPGTTSGGQIFYAAIGCACAFIAAIFVLVLAYYVRDKKTRRHRDPLQ
jgi:RYK receptor-like tyrosine kinase